MGKAVRSALSIDLARPSKGLTVDEAGPDKEMVARAMDMLSPRQWRKFGCGPRGEDGNGRAVGPGCFFLGG